MICEIHTKTILNTVKGMDDWFGLKYNMNLYRGCQHQCIYCDSRSECYQIENFADIHVKTNAIDLLADALPRKRVRGTIGTGSMNDPYMPVERKYRLTGRALEVIRDHHFPVHVITKSDLVLRDLDLLVDIGRVYSAVTFTITTADDDLARILEPGAPLPSARFEAMRALSEAGVLTGVTMMPILPFIEDTVENIIPIVDLAYQSGASYILPTFGMTLRAGSRDWYYAKLDRHFPGLKEKYIRHFGESYSISVLNWRELERAFQDRCARYGIADRMLVFTPEKVSKTPFQQNLF